MAPHQLEGGPSPEIEPGMGSAGRRQGWAWCWWGSETAPGSGFQTWGEAAMSPPPGPVGAGTWAHFPWAVSQRVPCSQACDTNHQSSHVTHTCVHVLPALMNKHVYVTGTQLCWDLAGRHTHTWSHDLVRTHPIQDRNAWAGERHLCCWAQWHRVPSLQEREGPLPWGPFPGGLTPENSRSSSGVLGLTGT